MSRLRLFCTALGSRIEVNRTFVIALPLKPYDYSF